MTIGLQPISSTYYCPVITGGVDLASVPARTASCQIEWTEGEATVTGLVPRGVDDRAILALMGSSDKVGLDVPLGWPEAFVTAVEAHRLQKPWPGGSQPELRLRATDRYVAAETGRWPLSVSSDRIACPAFRAAALLSATPDVGQRLGGGRIVEVYPVAALRRWDFDPGRYKQVAAVDARSALVSAFRRRTTDWLSVGADFWLLCESSHDAFDALVAALVARAYAVGLTDPCPVELTDVAAREGWIALPFTDSIDQLMGGAKHTG
jgi:Protein of unknown function (DUF429)